MKVREYVDQTGECLVYDTYAEVVGQGRTYGSTELGSGETIRSLARA